MPKVQIQIVTWNSQSQLERLFRGIENQAGIDYEVLVIDNASTDGTVEWLRKHKSVVEVVSLAPHPNPLPKGEGMVRLIQNQTNKGFAAAHNQGFAMCQAPYVLVLNPDTELQPGYLAEVVRVIESTPPPTPSSKRRGLGIAAVQGKLYRQLPEGEKYGIIDSCGLQMKPWGQIVDIGQNSSEKGNFGLQKEVFGATGACALYRLQALKQVADRHGIFDERFGSYKEDVDLAWRLRRAGWKAVFTPRAVAWHGRRVGKGDRRGWRIKWLSFRNNLLMLVKNL